MAQNYGQTGRQIGTAIGGFFGGNGQARQAGEMAGLQQVALEDQIEQRRVLAAAAQQKAAREQEAALLATPRAGLTRVAQAFQIPTDAVPDLEAWQRTGKLPMTQPEPLAPGLQGPEAPAQAPAWATPDNLSRIAQMFFADQSSQAGSSKTMEDAVKSLLLQPKVNLTAGVADGSITPGTGGARFAALEGKPLYAGHEYGVVNNFTGAVDDTSGPARRFATNREADTGLKKANTAQSYAAAGNSNASAAQTRAEMAGGGKAPSGYRWAANGTQEAIPGGPGDKRAGGGGAKAMPTAALKLQQEALDAIGTAGSMNADLSVIDKQIEDGKLQLGPVKNLVGTARNFAGASNDNSRNLESFKSTLEKLRNDSLRLNKGVQTDGDAQRAWNELLTNINDPKVVRQRLSEIKKINERGAALRRMDVDAIRGNFGLGPLESEDRFNQPAALGGEAGGGWSIKKKGQ